MATKKPRPKKKQRAPRPPRKPNFALYLPVVKRAAKVTR